MLQICPDVLGQKFVDHLFEEEILAFIRKLGYTEDIKSLSDFKRSKKDFHMSQASGSGDGVEFQSKVPDEQHRKIFSQDEDNVDEETDVNDDSEETESDKDEDDLPHSNLSTYKADDEEKEEEKTDDDEVSSDHRVSALETELSEFRQTNQFTEAIFLIRGIVDNYLPSKMKEAVDVAVQLQTNKLREEAQDENQEFLN
uniref:Uncharacterized protein n=1 Tax=Tanacetum cinerariifolium TaxID=118510 RepID=A0A699GHA6_TANCI|nr:hypothetical protein [Tanacetum cinerariifolium]